MNHDCQTVDAMHLRSQTGGGARRIRVPVLHQRGLSDCARTCLAMVLSHHGRFTTPDQLEDLLPEGRDGHSALTLIEAAQAEGLRVQGLRLDAAAVDQLAPGAILHWRGRHFVVYEGVARESIVIVDPARGRCRISVEELRRNFSGLAIALSPGPDLVARSRRRSGLERYVRPLFSQPRLLALGLLMSLGLTALALAVPLLTALLVDRVIPASRLDLLEVVAIGGVGLVLAQVLFVAARGLVFARLHERFDRQVVHELLARLFDLPHAFFQRRAVGDLVMRLGSVAEIREALTQGAISAFVDGILVIAYLIVLAVFSPMIAALAGALAIAQLAVFAIGHHRNRVLTDAYLAAEAESRGFQTRMLMGAQTLKATGSELEAQARFRELFEDVLSAGRARAQLSAWLAAAGAGLRTLGPVALLGLGAREVMSGSVSLGQMLGATQLALSFLVPVAALIAAATRLQLAVAQAERLEEIHETEPEQRSSEIVQDDVPLHGAVSLRGVGFRYPAASTWALRDVDLEIAAGQRVAIVGASGSGKSTLARVLLGLSPAQEGELRFDGRALADFNLRKLRQQLGVVEQEARLFDMSIAENIALGAATATRDDIELAARRARIHDEIVALPMGYDTRLGDGGSALSGGQRQRLALARALVRSPRLLLLDEATSALDTITETAIAQALDELECTVVTIAHRLSTVRRADQIIVMNDGRIVECGTHEELIARGGHYRALLDAQLEQ